MEAKHILAPVVLALSGMAQAEVTVELVSEPGDFIGQGIAYSYDDTNASISFTRNFDNGITMRIDPPVGQSTGDRWTLNLAAPADEELAVGSYAGATRFPFQDPTDPGLSMSGNGRGCNTLTGSFDILAVEYNEDGNVTALSATFEQFCGISPSAFRGEITFNTVTPVGAKALGLFTTRVVCRNRTTGQRIVLRDPDPDITDCRAAGLDVRPGDEVQVTVRGTAED